MKLDLIKGPIFSTLLCAVALALAVCIALPSPAMAATAWGLNGTMQASNVSLFVTRAFDDSEYTDYIYTSSPLNGRNLYLASWYSSKATVQPARIGAINIVQGDTPSFTIVLTPNTKASQASPDTPRPSPFRPVVAYGYTGPFDWDGSGAGPTMQTDNIMMAGGIDSNGDFSTVAANVILGLNGNILNQAVDIGLDGNNPGTFDAFATLPVGLAGAISTVDTSAVFYYDPTVAYGNVSQLLFGGENSTHHFTNTMYRPVYALSGQPMIPSGWTEVTPNTSGGAGVPEPRADMAGVGFQGKWWVFGGRNDEGVFGDLWTFEFATQTWTNVSDFGFLEHSEAQFDNATSQAGKSLPLTPPARYGHSMGLITGENRFGDIKDLIMLVGGTNGHTYFDDIWLLDPSSGNWEVIAPAQGQSSYTPRAFGALFTSTNTSQAWVFGGHNNGNGFHNNTLADLFIIDFTNPSPPGPAFKALPNNIIAGVAGGILLVLIITVIVLKVTDRNNN